MTARLVVAAVATRGVPLVARLTVQSRLVATVRMIGRHQQRGKRNVD